MKRVLLVTLFAIIMGSPAAQAQVQGSWTGQTQCYINGQWVTVHGNCPSSGGGGSGGGSSDGYGLPGAAFQLGYAFGRWLFGGSSNPAADAARQQQQQEMMEELARREAEAERQHREEEARRLTEMYNRLIRTLKLRGLPDLQLKERAGGRPGLQLKLRGDDDPDHAPGLYQDSEGKWYLKGISGLPGNYTGPGTEKFGDLVVNAGPGGAPSQLKTLPGLHMKTRDNQSAEGQNTLASATPGGAGLPGSQPPASSATMDPSKMTPQQLADAADAFSRLPPEQQQQIMNAVQQNAANPQAPGGMSQSPNTAAVDRLAQQAATSQAAEGQPSLEGASAQARVGFDTSGTSPADAQPIAGTTPGILHNGEAAPTPRYAEPPAPGTPSAQESAKVRQDLMQLLFPGDQSSASAEPRAGYSFPKNPEPPLVNPLREQQKVQSELKGWDDWAIKQAVGNKNLGGIYPATTEQVLLDTAAVKDYAPELLDRYKRDTAFRANLDQRLQSTDQFVALDYYQGIANAHKAAILEYQAELEKLVAAGKIEKYTPLEDQYRMHPERRAVVAEAWQRVSVEEQAAEDRARADGQNKLDKEYQFVFQLVRGQVRAAVEMRRM